ncbi:MAG: class I SAM-dependent methyltransferase [Bacteroidales bacterium]
MARKGALATGIDLDVRKIRAAMKEADSLGLKNVQFLPADATNLKSLFTERFDYAILSLAVHQFPENLRMLVLKQALQISRKLILADYTVPRPKNPAGYLALAMEMIAGGEHYAAYKTYLKAGGLPGILNDLDLAADKTIIISSGVFTVIECQGK